jgi:hypothetical protein
MSFCIHVLFDGELSGETALTRCFRELGFPLAFEHDASLPAQGACYLPMLLRGEEIGFELDVRNGRQDVEDIAGEEIDPRFTRAVSVQSAGGDEADAAASCFAAALAKLKDGLVEGLQPDRKLTGDEAIASAREVLHETNTFVEDFFRNSRPLPKNFQVLFHGTLPDKAALTRAFEELGLPLAFQSASGALHEDYLPMRLRGKECGIAFDAWDHREIFETLGAPAESPCGVNFYWGAVSEERTLAICLAAALARLTNGLVLGVHQDRRPTADEAIASAREVLEETDDIDN